MLINGVNLDPKILDTLYNDDLVIFAGAGISMGPPCNLDNFVELAKKIGEGTGLEFSDDDKAYPEVYLGKLKSKGVDIIDRLHDKLVKRNSSFNPLHENLIGIFPEVKKCRVITTNYDLFLEDAFRDLYGDEPKTYVAPALPLGKDFKGIVHLHGALHDDKNGIVLTDDDFGRAYLTEGWARRFLQDVFENNTVLFVGYSHDDTVIQYLARGLPPSNQYKRFVLTGACDEHDHWNHLGIEPFVFPQKDNNDFSKLYSSIDKLADLSTRGALNTEKRISEIVSSPSELDEETESHLEWYLSKESTTRFFCKHADDIEWLRWANKKDYLGFIFKQGEFDDIEKLLAEWYAKFCVENHQIGLKLFTSSPYKRPNSQVVRNIATKLIYADIQDVSEDIYAAWLPVLEPYISDWHYLINPGLFEKLKNIEAYDLLIFLFNTLLKPQAVIKPYFSFGITHKGDQLIDTEIGFKVKHYLIDRFYEKQLKVGLDIYYNELLEGAIQNLKRAYRLNKSWGKSDKNFDMLSIARAAIEPHDQDQYPDVIDVLINSARDTIEFLGDKNPDFAISKINALFQYESKLIQRIAIHAFCELGDLTAKEKLHWVIDNNLLVDIRLKHEVYRLISIIYPELTNEDKETAMNGFFSDIEKIYKGVNLEEEKKKKDIVYQKYNLLKWLQAHDESCELVSNRLDEILERYQNFKPRNHLDLTHWTSSGYTVPGTEPFSKDELLSKSAEEALEHILEKLPDREYDKESKLYGLTKACKGDESWGKDFAQELQDKNIKDSSIINSVLDAWVEQGLGALLTGDYYNFISDEIIQKCAVRRLSRHFQSLSEQENIDLDHEELNRFEGLVNSLWGYTEEINVGLESSSWLDRAINHPAGHLTLVWIRIISIDLQLREDGNEIITRILTERFEKIIEEATDSGTYGKAILGSQFAYLNTVDPDWTYEKLLPLFDFNNVDNAVVVWSGWLGWGRLNIQHLEVLLPSYKKAIEYLAQDDQKKNRGFASHVADLVLFVVSEPIDDLLNEFITVGSVNSRVSLINQIGNRLRNLVPEKKQHHWEKWIKGFIQLRSQSAPEKLTSDEYEGILNWIVHLEPVFEDAVSSFAEVEALSFQHSSVFSTILKSDLIESYPNAVMKLIIHVLEVDLKNYFCYQLKKVYEKLESLDKTEELYCKLGDRLAEMGCI